jgi:hypothetical protein
MIPLVRFVLLFTLLAGPAFAQPKPAAKKPADAKPAAAKPAAAASVEPATPEAAAKVLDLRTFPTLDGAKIGGHRTLGMLMYEAQATPKAGFDFQRQQLKKLGFAEAPGGYADEMNVSGKFTKAGYEVSVSASPAFDAEKKGWSNISVVNRGNVAPDKLPVPPGAKPFHPEVMPGSYLFDARVADTAAACRKLLIAAGWVPYDRTSNEAEQSMQHFKRNAILVQAWVSTAPAEGNKTLLRYSTELLQVDLPAPPDVEADYTDFQKTLRFDAPKDQGDVIVKFYQESLPKLGWAATTERPISDDVKKTKFLIFRNPQKELLSLDLTDFKDIVRVELSHQTAAEVAESERRAKEFAEKEKAKLAAQNKKINVPLPLPTEAKNLEQNSANLLEFELKTGSGPAALKALRDHLVADGWQEEEGTKLDKNTGRIDLKKDNVQIGLSYFDTTLTPVEIRVSGPKNVVFELAESDARPAETSEPKKPAKPEAKKPTKPALPGLPDLPPGVEIPDDVNDLIKKALEEAEKAKPTPKKPTPKR